MPLTPKSCVRNMNTPSPCCWARRRRILPFLSNRSTFRRRSFRPCCPARCWSGGPISPPLSGSVAAANAQIGVAQSAYYPTIGFNISAGLEGNSILNWFTWPSRFWSVGPTLAQTLFEMGGRKAFKQEMIADYDATVAGYRQTVLTAFRQVEDNLAALRILEREEKEQQQAVNSSALATELSLDQYKGGITNYLQVITAQAAELGDRRTFLLHPDSPDRGQRAAHPGARRRLGRLAAALAPTTPAARPEEEYFRVRAALRPARGATEPGSARAEGRAGSEELKPAPRRGRRPGARRCGQATRESQRGQHRLAERDAAIVGGHALMDERPGRRPAAARRNARSARRSESTLRSAATRRTPVAKRHLDHPCRQRFVEPRAELGGRDAALQSPSISSTIGRQSACRPEQGSG